MILPPYESLFVHIPKTGGQSVENYLLQSLNKTREAHGAQFLLKKNNDPLQGPQRLAHLTADEYVAYGYLTPIEFKSWFKFSFTRNPWDRLVSFYKYRGFSSVVSFNNFILYYLPEYFENEHWFFKNQADFLFDSNEVLQMDFLGKTENLQSDFSKVAHRLSIHYDALPRNNRSIEGGLLTRKSVDLILKHPRLLFQLHLSSRNTKNYKDVFTEASRKTVRTLYEKDIDLLKYTF